MGRRRSGVCSRREFAGAAADAAVQQDEARLHEVLRHRKENFETHGDIRQLVPGRSWAAWARALGHLLPPLDVVDIGCGDGYLTLEAARWARTVYGIDRSDEVLERAKALAARRRVTNVQWKKGDLARLPLRDGSVDVALLSQALHHAAAPGGDADRSGSRPQAGRTAARARPSQTRPEMGQHEVRRSAGSVSPRPSSSAC